MKSTRLIIHAFCVVLLCALFAVELSARKSGSPGRQTDNLSTLAPFTALVTSKEAQFILPVPARPRWRWRLPETTDNMQEYRLDVGVENEGRKYNFGFYLWKRAGATPDSGSFSELMRAGQLSVFGRTPAGMNSIIRDAGIKTKLDKDMLIIAIRGKENVARLFSAHPAEVTFEIKVPDEAPMRKTVQVVYQD
jgi:hypothetical protein